MDLDVTNMGIQSISILQIIPQLKHHLPDAKFTTFSQADWTCKICFKIRLIVILNWPQNAAFLTAAPDSPSCPGSPSVPGIPWKQQNGIHWLSESGTSGQVEVWEGSGSLSNYKN